MQQTSKICIHTPPLNVQCGQCWEILSSAQMNCRRKSSLTTTSGVVEVLASTTADFCLQIVQSHHLKDLKSSTFTAMASGTLPASAEVSARMPLCYQLQNQCQISLGLNTQAGPHLQTLSQLLIQQQLCPIAQLSVLARHTQNQQATTTGLPVRQYFNQKAHVKEKYLLTKK